jgi:hypothetical protein
LQTVWRRGAVVVGAVCAKAGNASERPRMADDAATAILFIRIVITVSEERALAAYAAHG